MAEGPDVWLLLGAKAGDNAQVTELAARLPVKTDAKQLTFNALHIVPNLLLGVSTVSITDQSRNLLQQPWPDAVIAAGKRSVPIARWIKQQSGGRTKLIHIGRPRAPLDAFDLVVTTPQYGLPRDANVLELGLPLTAKRAAAPEQIAKWRDEWALLPRPLVLCCNWSCQVSDPPWVGGGRYNRAETEHRSCRDWWFSRSACFTAERIQGDAGVGQQAQCR